MKEYQIICNDYRSELTPALNAAATDRWVVAPGGFQINLGTYYVLMERDKYVPWRPGDGLL